MTGDHKTVAIVELEKDTLLVKTDIKNIFPKIQNQRCLLVTEATDIQAVWEEVQGYLTEGDFLICLRSFVIK